jgi:plasmid stabilization system protein ParE
VVARSCARYPQTASAPELALPQLTWRPEALDDIAGIDEYLSEHSPAIAQRTIADILARVTVLQDFPFIGRAVASSRHEMVLGDYVIVYRTTPDETAILRVWHRLQDRSQH